MSPRRPSPPPSIIVGPSVAAAGGPESMSAELAGLVSASTHSLPAGSHPSSGGRGASGPMGPPQVGVSALGYPSGLTGPLDSSLRSGEQVSSSIATVITVEPSFSSSFLLAAAPYQQQLASRQPIAAATETAAAQGLTTVSYSNS